MHSKIDSNYIQSTSLNTLKIMYKNVLISSWYFLSKTISKQCSIKQIFLFLSFMQIILHRLCLSSISTLSAMIFIFHLSRYIISISLISWLIGWWESAHRALQYNVLILLESSWYENAESTFLQPNFLNVFSIFSTIFL